MALSVSLQPSHGLGLRKKHMFSKEIKIRRGELSLLSTTLSSCAWYQQQDPWSTRLSKSFCRPITSALCRSNSFKCHCLLPPVQAITLSAFKSASVVVTRSYNALRGSPFLARMVPALGIILFAVWGLGPLIRHCRNILLHKNDNSWKKSSAYYLMNSYIQPLLLWTGAILICRALDPMVLPTEASQVVKQRLLNFVRSLSTVLAFAYCLSSVVQQAQKFFMESNDSSDPRNMGFQFAGKALYSAVWVAAVSLFMELLGFSTQKWLTAGGLGTVLLTLAGREIFTNFLSSAMIHATRPFVVNEWIQTRIEGYDVSGTVEHVGWWSPTIVRGEDREAVHIPNHKFTMNVVRNLTQKTHWRIKTHLGISHLDVNKINIIVADMRKVLSKNPQVEQQRLHRRVFLDNINPENQALMILVSCFVKTSHFEEYLCVKEAIMLDLLRVISHHRARLATPIRTVQKIYSDVDVDNIPFADSNFRRGGAASNRPLLLIEPSYRINGEDKTKSQARADPKAGAVPKSDLVSKETTQEVKTTTKPAPEPKSSDSEIGAVEKSGSSVSGNSSQSNSENSKVTTQAKAKTNSKSTELPNSNSKPTDSVADKKNMSDSNQQSPKATRPFSSSEIGIDKAGRLPESSQTKQDEDRKSASQKALEENIVLGVALDGSKRVLPIEDDIAAPHPKKDMAGTHQSADASPRTEKDLKDA